MRPDVVFTQEAEQQLLELFWYIAEHSSADTAARYTEGLIGYCESLDTFPHRGTMRDDLRPGLRITNYRRRTVIAFTVQPDRVEILGIFHGGRDYSTLPGPRD